MKEKKRNDTLVRVLFYIIIFLLGVLAACFIAYGYDGKDVCIRLNMSTEETIDCMLYFESLGVVRTVNLTNNVTQNVTTVLNYSLDTAPYMTREEIAELLERELEDLRLEGYVDAREYEFDKKILQLQLDHINRSPTTTQAKNEEDEELKELFYEIIREREGIEDDEKPSGTVNISGVATGDDIAKLMEEVRAASIAARTSQNEGLSTPQLLLGAGLLVGLAVVGINFLQKREAKDKAQPTQQPNVVYVPQPVPAQPAPQPQVPAPPPNPPPAPMKPPVPPTIPELKPFPTR